MREDEKEEPTEKRADGEEIQGEATRHTDDAWSSELKQRREAHGNTRGHFREERLTTKSSTEKRRAMFAGENRREERRRADANGGQGFVSVNTLLSDETGVETNP